MSACTHRRATEADLGPIAALDAECFGNPWSRELYRQELTRPFARLHVAEADGHILGLWCAWIIADEAHLLRIATRASRRRQGLARSMLHRIVGVATEAGCRQILLEVAAANAAAVALYEAFAFERVGRRAGYYTRPPDDALVMRRGLASADAPAGAPAGV